MPDTPSIDIRPDHWEIVQSVLHRHVPQHEVWAFGSRAKWTAKEYSDLDLAVITDKSLPLDVIVGLSDDFSESDLPYKVDVVDWATTNESFKKIIERDRVVVQKVGRGRVMDFEFCTKAPESWARMTIDDVCTRITSGGTPSRRTPEFFINGSVPWVKTQELQDGWIRATDEKITEDAVKKSSVKLLPANSVLLAMYGATVGQLGVLASPMACNQACCALIVNDEIADFRYIYYLLLQHRAVIKSLATGAAQQNLSAAQIKQFKFAFPDRQAQGQVADLLSGLDDKIDLNRRTNLTLEAMAQAIFKSWFVDFDPVKAKIAARQEGRDPLRAAMSAISGKAEAELDALPREQYQQLAATAALFPDEMEKSELGEIPRGWGAGVFKECCLRVESGGTPSRKEPAFWDGSIPWLTSGEVREVVVLDTREKITCAGLASSSAKLWPAMTTVVAMYGATAGQVCLIAEEMTANQACCALIPKSEFRAFVFIAARQSIQQLLEKASGSAQQNLNKSLVENHAQVIPDRDVAEAFEMVTTKLLQKWILNQRSMVTLGALRDTLLPKLLSGELSVSAATAGGEA